MTYEGGKDPEIIFYDADGVTALAQEPIESYSRAQIIDLIEAYGLQRATQTAATEPLMSEQQENVKDTL